VSVVRKNGKTRLLAEWLELADSGQRKELCKKLWDCLELSDGMAGCNMNGKWTDRYELYRQFGEMLLGDDCPEWEVRT
jgi:hypothetical protein